MNDDGESGDPIFIPSDDFNPEFSTDLNPPLDPLKDQETYLSLNFNFNGSNEHGIQCKYCNIRYKDFHTAVNHSCMPFRCIQCATAFLYDYQLKMHKCSKKNSERTTDTVCSVTQEDSLCICSVCGSTFADSKLLSNHNCAKKKPKNCQICGKILSSKCLGVYCGGCKNKAKNNKYSLRHKNPLSVSSTSLSELSSNDATNSSSETQNAFNACNQLKKIIHDFHNGIESSDLSENASSTVHLSKKRRRVNGSGKLSKRKPKQNVLGGNSDSTDIHQVDPHETQSLYPKSKKRASISKRTKNNSTSIEKGEERDILINNAAPCNDISKSSTVISNSKEKFGKMRYSLRCERVNKIAPSLSTSETSESHISDNISENNSTASDELEKAAEINSTAVSNGNNQDTDLSVTNLPKRKKNDVASRISEDGDLENNCEDDESVKLSDTSVNNVPRNKNWTAKGKRNKVFKRSGRNNVRCEMKSSNALTSSDCANSIESTNNSISDSVHLSTGSTDVDGQTAGCNVEESRIPPVNQISEIRDNLLDSNKILVSTEKNPTSKSKNIFNMKESNMNEIRLTEKSSSDSNECVTTASLQKSDKGNSNILLSTLQTKEKVIAQKIIPSNISKFKHKRLPKERTLISEALATDSSQPSTSRILKQVSCVKRKRAATPSDGSFEGNSTQKVTFSCELSEDTCSKTKKQTIPCSTLSRAPVPAGNSIFATSNFRNTVADGVGVRKQKSTSSTSPRNKFFSDNVHGKGKNAPIFNSSKNFGTPTSSIKSDHIPSSDRNSVGPQICPNLSETVSLEVLFKALPNYGGVVSKVLTDGCFGYRCPKCNHIFRQIKKATDHSRICQIFKLIKKTSISIQEVEFVCTSCYQHWSSLDELYNHKKYCPVLLIKNNVQISDFIHSYDKANKNYVCPKCSYSCLSSYKFSQHPCKKRLESMKTCFVKVEKLSEHEVGSEENVFKIVCPTCQSVFSDFIEFENHSKMHVNVGLNAAKSQVDCGKAYAKKEIKKVITNNKNCSSVEDMMKMILEPVSEILACMDSNNAFPDFNLDIPLPYEQQKLFNEAVKQVLTDADENMDSVNKTSNAQEVIGLENLFASKDCNFEGHTSSADNDDTFMKDFRCKCIKDTLDPKMERKPCLKCLNDYMLSKLNESGKDFTLSAPVTAPTSVPSSCGSSTSLASCSDLFRNLVSCSSSFSAVSSISDFITTEAPVSGCNTASFNSEAPVVLSSVSLAPPESQATSSPRSSTVIQDKEENIILASFSSESDSNVTNDVVPGENRIAPDTSDNNTDVTNSAETSIPSQKTPEEYATSTFTFTNADECSSSTQSDCKIVYCYLPPNSAFSLDQKQTNVELISEIKPEETFGTEFENMLPIVKVIQDESKNDKVVLYPKIETDCKNSAKRKSYMEKLSKMCHNLIIKSELLQPLKPEVLESCRCKNALCECNRVPSPQLCEKDQAYLVLDDTQSAPLSDRKIIYWVFEKLMDQFLKEENDFSISFDMFPPFGVTVSIDWYLDPDTVYSVYALKDSMQFACGTCIEELSVSSLLEHVIEKHKETVINILIA